MNLGGPPHGLPRPHVKGFAVLKEFDVEHAIAEKRLSCGAQIRRQGGGVIDRWVPRSKGNLNITLNNLAVAIIGTEVTRSMVMVTGAWEPPGVSPSEIVTSPVVGIVTVLRCSGVVVRRSCRWVPSSVELDERASKALSRNVNDVCLIGNQGNLSIAKFVCRWWTPLGLDGDGNGRHGRSARPDRRWHPTPVPECRLLLELRR